MAFIPYGRQDITDSDIHEVVAVLKSDFLTQGPVVPRFENKVAEYCGAKYALAVNSATSGLHIACLALGLQKGDRLWTTPITFVASANCGLYCGAEIDFVDIDPQTYNLCPDALTQKLEKAEREGNLPKIVVAVHLAGQSCDMEAIKKLSDQYGFYIIEDASHAIGGKYKNAPIGNGKYSDVTIFSFHPVKIITTGEGGMVLTNDAGIASKMDLLRSHGITRDPNLMTQDPDGAWYYEQIDLGYNYRMTDLQAALGLSQIQRLDDYVAQRHKLAKRYDKSLDDLPLILPYQRSDSYSGFHLYIVRLKLDLISSSQKQVFDRLREQELGVNLHYIPIYRQPYYEKFGFAKSDFPEAEAYYSEAITIPLFPTLTLEQHDSVCRALEEVLV